MNQVTALHEFGYKSQDVGGRVKSVT